MNKTQLIKDVEKHMKVLCADIPERRVGGEGNRQATEYVKGIWEHEGLTTEETLLSVIDWQTEGASLHYENLSFEVFPSPYALGCDLSGELVAVDSFEKLSQTDIKDKIILL